MQYSFLGANESYVLTPEDVMQRKLELLDLKDGDCLCDLGCGDARSLIMGCTFAKIRGIGYDILPEAVAISKRRVQEAGLVDQIDIRQQDLYQADLCDVDALVLYFNRGILGSISLKLENELPLGARIVTHQFDLPAWTAEIEEDFIQSDGCVEKIYLYRKG